MLTYQKNTLLGLLANFKARLYDSMEYPQEPTGWRANYYLTIDRNITSIEKQIKKL